MVIGDEKWIGHDFKHKFSWSKRGDIPSISAKANLDYAMHFVGLERNHLL